MLDPLQIHTSSAPYLRTRSDTLAATAKAFEAMVVSQMLQAAGADKPLGEFGGGAGEAQFASFLTDAHAKALVAHGGFGLAERLIRSMTVNGGAS